MSICSQDYDSDTKQLQQGLWGPRGPKCWLAGLLRSKTPISVLGGRIGRWRHCGGVRRERNPFTSESVWSLAPAGKQEFQWYYHLLWRLPTDSLPLIWRYFMCKQQWPKLKAWMYMTLCLIPPPDIFWESRTRLLTLFIVQMACFPVPSDLDSDLISFNPCWPPPSGTPCDLMKSFSHLWR